MISSDTTLLPSLLFTYVLICLSAPLPLRSNPPELRPANLATLGPPTKTRGGIADQVWNDKYAVMIQRVTSVYICNLPK